MTAHEQETTLNAKVLTNKIAEVKELDELLFRKEQQNKSLLHELRLANDIIKVQEALLDQRLTLINKMKKDGYTNGK